MDKNEREEKLKVMKLECEISDVSAAKQRMSMKILEREMDIERLEKDIAVQEKRLAELEKQIKDLK